LQAVVEITGVDESIYDYGYRTVPIRDEDPFFDRDYNLCIACVRCVRVCDEVIGADAISMVQKGDRVLPGTPFDLPLSDPASGCIHCGACVDSCPVGALTEKDNKWAGLPDRTVTTVCDQCEIGCQMTVELQGEKVLRVVPDLDGGANGGLACVKGKFQLTDSTRREDRLLQPLIRQNNSYDSVSWDTALNILSEALAKNRGEQFALITTGTSSNEDAYLLQKLARQVQGSNNIDNIPRALSPAITEMADAFGVGVSTNEIKDIAKSKSILFMGADLNSTHPVAAYQIHKAVNYIDAELISVTATVYPEISRAATQNLQINNGTEKAFLHGMLKVVFDENLVDQEFIENRVEDIKPLRESVATIQLDSISNETGIAVESIQRAARSYASNTPSSIVYAVDPSSDSKGITAMLTNLALITGSVGNASSGVHVFLPQGNAQGIQDIGAAPSDTENDFEAILDGIESGNITSLLWAGDLSTPTSFTPRSLQERVEQELPDELITRLQNTLPKLDFLAVASLAPSFISELADVVLPTTSFLERDGTYTNSERRVQRIRASLAPAGETKPVWKIVNELATSMGATEFNYSDASSVFDDIAQNIENYKGLSFERLDSEFTGIQWPVPDADHPGTPTLHNDKFLTASGLARVATI
jgi:predicted molibdopterin-dependent oxidoreductase YjgC